jgi:hypothetical protein
MTSRNRSTIVAKRRDNHYRSGRCREWIKIKNPAHAAIARAMLITLSKRHRARDLQPVRLSVKPCCLYWVFWPILASAPGAALPIATESRGGRGPTLRKRVPRAQAGMAARTFFQLSGSAYWPPQNPIS